MGLKKYCRCPCFRAKFYPNDETPLQPLPKPKEAGGIDGLDTAPYVDGKEEDILIIRGIDPRIQFNGENHHTAKYELMKREIDPELVVRRGQPFNLILSLSRPYHEIKDGISFIFSVEDEEKPSYGQGTFVAVPLSRKLDRAMGWCVALESVEGNDIRLQVLTPPDCVVAKWKMDVDTKIIDGNAYSYCWTTGIYILYNPWCKQDQVFMKSEEWRDETVLADVGLIWRGTFNRLRPCIWNYSQFEEHVLECSLYLINVIGRIRGNFRSDPVVTARAISAAVNSVDDDGAVMGNWSEDFSGGTPPTKWMGSKDILQQYYKKKKPVKYGQCWVFSGVITTICRAVGLPARTLTNYSSAHDTQSSLTVDFFLDENGKKMDKLNSDSIWNFHTWNEVWMQRPDLGKDYGGWQAIDATPQEASGDLYRVGPSSVIAVKHGEVRRPYDTGFLFAEVNADKVYWRYTGENKPLKLITKDIYGIGKLIITKLPGKFEYENVTNSYKHPEKTQEERDIMLKALRQSENQFARYYLNEDFNDVRFNFEMRDDIKIGKPFYVSLIIKNRNKSKDYTIDVVLRVDAVTYTGRVGESVKIEKYEVLVKAESIHEVKLHVAYMEYAKKLLDQGAFSIGCLAQVRDTNYEYYAQDDFRVRKPDIKIILIGTPYVGQEITAELSLENPLPTHLKRCEFNVEGAGIKEKLTIKLKQSVPPGEKATAQVKFVPPDVGYNTIAAKFVSKEIQDIDGFLNFLVEVPKEENGNR